MTQFRPTKSRNCREKSLLHAGDRPLTPRNQPVQLLQPAALISVAKGTAQNFSYNYN